MARRKYPPFPREARAPIFDIGTLEGLGAFQKFIEGKRRYVPVALRRLVDDIGVTVETTIIPRAIEKLKKEPPDPPPRPIQWKSDKQRRYVMWLIRTGQWTGRTHKLSGHWQGAVDITYSGDNMGIRLEIFNDMHYTAFVQGIPMYAPTQAQMRYALHPIQPFHKKRWPEAPRIITRAVNQARKLATEMVRDTISDIA